MREIIAIPDNLGTGIRPGTTAIGYLQRGGCATKPEAAKTSTEAVTSAGVELFLTSRWTLLTKFDGEFANSSQTYGGSGTLRYVW